MWNYLIQVSLGLCILALGFALLPKGRTSHRFSRFLILSGWVLAFLFPLIPQSWSPPTAELVGFTLPEITIGEQIAGSAGMDFNPWSIIKWIYLMGVVWGLIQLLREGLRIFAMQRKAESILEDGWVIHLVPGLKEPCSFLDRIFLPLDTPAEWRSVILSHESAHARLGHSIDLLVLELSSVFVWFLPPAWWLKRGLRNIHEYEVDLLVTRDTSLDRYKEVLLQVMFNSREPLLMHGFSVTNLKERIQMIRNPKPISRWYKWTLMLSIGLLIGAVAGCEKNVQSIEPQPNHSPHDHVAFMEADMPPLPDECQGETDKEAGVTCFQRSLTQHIIQNMVYPDAAQKKGLSGVAYITFLIDHEGQVDQIRTVRIKVEGSEKMEASKAEEAETILGHAGVDVIKKLPKFNPAVKDGEPVSIEYTVPLRFALN